MSFASFPLQDKHKLFQIKFFKYGCHELASETSLTKFLHSKRRFRGFKIDVYNFLTLADCHKEALFQFASKHNKALVLVDTDNKNREALGAYLTSQGMRQIINKYAECINDPGGRVIEYHIDEKQYFKAHPGRQLEDILLYAQYAASINDLPELIAIIESHRRFLSKAELQKLVTTLHEVALTYQHGEIHQYFKHIENKKMYHKKIPASALFSRDSRRTYVAECKTDLPQASTLDTSIKYSV